MGDISGFVAALTGAGTEEMLRLAYATSGLVPAGIVVGGAAVLAGLLGAAMVKRVRTARPSGAPLPAGSVPWVLGAATLAAWLGAAPASAAVLCRKGDSHRLVLRADACRAREQTVQASQLGLAPEETCLEALDLAWREVETLRAHLEGARDLALRLEAQPWEGGEVWLAIQAVEITGLLSRLTTRLDALGCVAGHDTIARLHVLVSEEWAHPAAACAAALALLPALEASLPVPPAL